MNQEVKICQNCKQSFTIEPEDFVFYQKIKVPPPTWCPECRMVRRMIWRNERTLYKRKCDVPGHNEEIISIYHKDSPVKVYDQKYWWSDEWDPMDYGKDYDFNKPFFEQWRELRNNFPFQSVSNSRAENSEYCNVNDKSKDCYLISASYENERVFYSNRVGFNKDCFDLYIGFKDQFCYENVMCEDNYNLFYSKASAYCVNCYLLYDCRNCQNCFGCIGLRNKQYYIFNNKYTKEDYELKIKEYDLGSFRNLVKIKQEFHELYLKTFHKYCIITKSINVLGNYIGNSKNCYYCFDAGIVENCKFINWIVGLKDSYDAGPGVGDSSELVYEIFDTIKGSKLIATSVVYNSYNINYSFNCHNSSNLFACIGLRNKQYCILNKQYTKEEYEKLVPKIIEHMNKIPYTDKKGRIYKYGEFFPPELSPFAYNETIAQEYFPLIKEQALEQGYSWKEPEERNIKIDIKTEDLPDHIKDVKDDIIGKVIQCQHAQFTTNDQQLTTDCNEQCVTAFKIIEPELSFYRKMNLPLPRLCPNCRHYQRLKQRNPLKLWHRQCQCAGATSDRQLTTNDKQPYKYTNTIAHFHGNNHCPNEFETTYAPDRPEIIYCEKCYQAEVV